MAASSEGTLKINLVHGAKSHSILLSLSPEDYPDVLTVNHLVSAAENLSGIPPDRQKLIFKGKTLNPSGDTSKSLRSFGIKNGSKVMLLGSKPPKSPKESGTHHASEKAGDAEAANPFQEDLTKLQSLETTLAKEAESFHSLLQEVDSEAIHTSNDTKQLEQLKKRLMVSTESFMRMLESLDGLRFDSMDTDSRAKRKAIVNQLQKWMDQSEELSASIKQKLADRK